MKIQAAVAVGANLPFEVRDLTLSDPRDDEVLVRIAGVGLCHTDIIARDGMIPVVAPSVLGHEGSGVVERVGAAVTKVKPGDRVAMSFHSCGTCDACRAHNPAYCLHVPALNFTGARPDGSTSLSDGDVRVSSNFFGQSSFASHALAYERNLVVVADAEVPLEILGPLGCGIQTGAGAILRSLDCPAGSSVLIVGGGSVGLAAVMAAVARGCDPIILVEPHAARRALATEFGCHHTIDPRAEDVAEAVRKILPDGVAFAFDTSGRPESFAAMFAAMAIRGVIGLVSAQAADTQFSVDANGLIIRGITVRGIVEGDSDPDIFIPEMIGMFKAGTFPIDRLVTSYPLSRINDAIADQHAGTCIKAILIPDPA